MVKLPNPFAPQRVAAVAELAPLFLSKEIILCALSMFNAPEPRTGSRGLAVMPRCAPLCGA